MVRQSPDRILLIGDIDRQVLPALTQALPAAVVTQVDNYFDGIAELSNHRYAAVLANAEPIERRPEAAIQMLRELAPEGRLILFGHPTLEPVSRKMLEFGCNDYVVTPPRPGELLQIFGGPVMRLAPSENESPESPPPTEQESGSLLLQTLPVSDIALAALADHPGLAVAAAIDGVNQQIGPNHRLRFIQADQNIDDGVSVPILDGDQVLGLLQLTGDGVDPNSARHFLTRAAETFGKLITLQERHKGLTRLATTDQLTGVANRRFFEHYLAKLLATAQAKRFPVSLLLFDIDNFKKYNDECGHATGDEILRETAELMRRCCRKHDLVARIGGDEFAVVFWEKEGPRQPKENAQTVSAAERVPQEPLQILKRFHRAISSQEFSGLGTSGRGTLTISGGLASYPWDGRTVAELVEKADHALVFGAKKSGKNSIHLVGGNENVCDDAPAEQPESDDTL
jgi:two-component system cell cycle response regulator